MFDPSHASLLSVCQPRAPHLTNIAPRAARACLGSVFFGASDQLGIMPQGRHTGIETGQSVTKKPVLPFSRGFHRTSCSFAEGVRPFFAGHHWDYRSWSKWANSLDSRSLCLGHSGLPLPCENRRLSMRFLSRLFFSSSSVQTVLVGLSTGAYFLVLLHRSE